MNMIYAITAMVLELAVDLLASVVPLYATVHGLVPVTAGIWMAAFGGAYLIEYWAEGKIGWVLRFARRDFNVTESD